MSSWGWLPVARRTAKRRCVDPPGDNYSRKRGGGESRVETPRVEIPFSGCRSPICLSGSHAGMVPSETPRRVYTRDALFGGVCASAIGDLRVRPAPRCQCQKPRAVCTREMGFLTAVGLGGALPSESSSHVYTRDRLSGKASLHNAWQLGKCRGPTASPPTITSHVYTRDALPGTCRGRWFGSFPSAL